jgi:hypothetical protein
MDKLNTNKRFQILRFHGSEHENAQDLLKVTTTKKRREKIKKCMRFTEGVTKIRQPSKYRIILFSSPADDTILFQTLSRYTIIMLKIIFLAIGNIQKGSEHRVRYTENLW